MKTPEEFLHKKYPGLNTSSEVKTASRDIPEYQYQKRIDAYLDRMEAVFNPSGLKEYPNFDRKKRNSKMFESFLYKKFIIKEEEVPESYWNSIKERHLREGRGNIEISEDLKKELIKPVIADQKKSLDNWFNYLISDNAKYPNYLKYWAMRSILFLQTYDKKKKEFSKRSKGSVNPFPELNREALSLVLNSLEKKHEDEEIKFGYDINQEIKQNFINFLNQENFAKLYALAIEEFKPISEELLQETEGQWVEYPKGSNPDALIKSLAEYGTGWCIRGEETARRYLEDNNLIIFYSNDKNGKPNVPRSVIVMTDGGKNISEARGVYPDEELDPYIGEVVDKKLKTYPGGEKFKKRSADINNLDKIYKKCFNKDKKYLNPQLSKEELSFLYELDSKIEHFGYEDKHPRIKEIRDQRNIKEDMFAIFECSENEIASNPLEINENTKAYVGKIAEEDEKGELLPQYKGIFKKFKQYNIEYIYTDFSEERIEKIKNIKWGGKTKEQLKEEFKKAEKEHNIHKSDYVKDIFDEMSINEKEETILDLIKIKVNYFNLKNPTTENIYKRAQELGLELCPAEIGPHLRLQYLDQSLNEYLRIGMRQITDSGYNFFFDLFINDGLWLDVGWDDPDSEWVADIKFVFLSSEILPDEKSE